MNVYNHLWTMIEYLCKQNLAFKSNFEKSVAFFKKSLLVVEGGSFQRQRSSLPLHRMPPCYTSLERQRAVEFVYV